MCSCWTYDLAWLLGKVIHNFIVSVILKKNIYIYYSTLIWRNIFTVRIAHTAKVVFSEFLSFWPQGGGGVSGKKCTLSTLLLQKCWCLCVGGVSGKVHSEHIVATKGLMPGGCPGQCTLSTLLLQKCWCLWGGGGSRKVHSEHIVATKVLMPVGGCLGKCTEHIVATKVLMPVGGGCPGKCTLSTLLLQKCSYPWGVGYLVKCTLSTFLLPAWGMQSIFKLPSCVIYIHA